MGQFNLEERYNFEGDIFRKAALYYTLPLLHFGFYSFDTVNFFSPMSFGLK